MPWRKYTSKTGKYGPIYHISKGVQVRQNAMHKWTLFIERGGDRKNKTIGSGRGSLVKAIKAAETIASKLHSTPLIQINDKSKSEAPKFKQFSADWINDNARRWNEYTFMRYESILRLHLWPHEIFKAKRINEINRIDIKKRLRLLLKTHSPATVELVHTVLCSIFQEAVEDEVISSNPAKGILKTLLPPKKNRNVNASDPFDTEEKDPFLDYSEKICTWPEQLILKAMVYMGLRLGEALAMRLMYLDLKKMSYYVSGSYKQHRFNLPKMGKKRFVDIPNFLAKEFSQYMTFLKKQSLQEGNGREIDLLFPDPKESGYWPYSQRKIQGIIKRVCKSAQLRVRNPHDLRHTYASILLMANKSPAYVKEQLGHSSIMITVDIYGHWIPGKGREGLEDALLGSVQKSHKIAYKEKQLQ